MACNPDAGKKRVVIQPGSSAAVGMPVTSMVFGKESGAGGTVSSPVLSKGGKMELNSSSFFSKKGDHPVVTMTKTDDPLADWPFMIRLSGGLTSLDFYVSDESDLIAFKNNVIDAYRKHHVREGRI